MPRPLGSLLSCIVLCGCPEARSRGDDDPVPAGESGDGVVVGPQILNPGSEPLRIGTDHHHDIELQVAGVTPSTRILRDSHDLAPSVHPPAATLAGDRLTLHFAGSMVPGAHTVLLQSADANRVSERVRFDVEARALPPLEVAFPEAELGPATALVGGAFDRHDALGLIEHDPAVTRLHVYAPRDEGWHPEPTVFELPSAWNREHPPTITMHGDPPRPLVAWTEGQPADTLAWATPDTPVQRARLLDDLRGNVEFAQLGGLRFVGDRLLVEREAYGDVEAPRPGDRSVVELPVGHAGLGRARPLAELATGDAVEVRAVVDVGRRRWLDRPVALVHRSAGAPALVQFGADVPTLLPMPDARPELAPMHVEALVVGGFESRILLASTPTSPAWWLVMHDLSSGAAPLPHPLGILRDEAPTVVATQLRGVPVFLFARGSDRPVLAVLADRPTPEPVALDPLRCDALVVRAGVVVDDRGRAALACRRSDTVLLGALALATGPRRTSE